MHCRHCHGAILLICIVAAPCEQEALPLLLTWQHGKVRALVLVLVLAQGFLQAVPKQPLISYGAAQLHLYKHNLLIENSSQAQKMLCVLSSMHCQATTSLCSNVHASSRIHSSAGHAPLLTFSQGLDQVCAECNLTAKYLS